MIPDPAGTARLRRCAIALYVLALVATCGRATEPRHATAPERIITVGGPVTEIVFALGRGDRVVAVDTSSVYPPAATALPQVGYQRTLSAESLLALAPDLVLASSDAGPPAALEQLRAAGIEVELVPVASTIDDAARRIEAVGVALGDRSAARVLAAAMHADATRAAERWGTAGRPGTNAVVVYARGAGTVMLAGTETPATAMLALAGGQNAISGFSGFKPISPEALVAAAPEVIVVPARSLASLGGEPGLLAIPGISQTPAGRARRIVAIDDPLLLGFGPRLPAAIDALARGLSAEPR